MQSPFVVRIVDDKFQVTDSGPRAAVPTASGTMSVGDFQNVVDAIYEQGFRHGTVDAKRTVITNLQSSMKLWGE